MTATTLDKVEVDGLTIAYRELGSGPPVLLLHGWPTSSFLWREVMEPVAERNRVVAIDLPGFGASDKPLGRRIRLRLFERTLDGFLAALGIEEGSGLRCTISAAPWACIGRCTPGARDEAGAPEHARLSGVLRSGVAVHHGVQHAGASRAAHKPGWSRGGDAPRPRR